MMIQACTAPVVLLDEHVQPVANGLRKIGKMSKAQIDEFLKDAKKGEVKDKEVMGAVVVIEKAMKGLYDAMTGSIQGKDNVLKAIYGEGLLDGSGDMVMSNIRSLREPSGMDVAWMQVIRSIDATGSRTVRNIDLHTATRFLQYKNSSDQVKYHALSSGTEEDFGPKYFAAGFQWSERDNRFTRVSINDLLSELRFSALDVSTRHAYREIFRKQTGTDDASVQNYAAPSTYASAPDTIRQDLAWGLRIREQLNEVRRKMIERAMGIQPKNKKRQANIEVPLAVSANTPIYLFYNHAHDWQFKLAMGITADQTGVAIPSQPWVMVPTVNAPLSGGWKITNEGTEKRDDFGFFGELDEYVPDSLGIGGMAVIPGLRNVHAIFRNFSLLRENEEIAEVLNIAAKIEENIVLEARQKARVAFGTEPTVS